MTRVRFPAAVVAVVLAGGLSAAPVPKGAGTGEPAPDLKAFFAAAGKAVEGGKWPAADDEKALRDTARAVFERATAAADRKDRKLPLDFDVLNKLGVVKELKDVKLDGDFVIAGEAQLTVARNSVIFATGPVQVTRATNCVILAPSVRANTLDNCLVVASDYIRSVGADRKNRDEGSVLVAGRLIRVTGARGAICHVIRPEFGQPLPDEKVEPTAPPIRITSANSVVVLNAEGHWKTTSNKYSGTVVPKTPIAK